MKKLILVLLMCLLPTMVGGCSKRVDHLAEGKTFLCTENNRTVFKVDSGSYKFVSKNY